MIRFCDREVGFVEYASLNRKELLEYFTSGHEEDMICVYDDFAVMRYIGKITLYSLQHSININSAIQKEYVILDKDMWYEARKYFTYRNGISQDNFLLPILNKEGQLVCFAYEDEDANREIRQLRELSEMSEALQFSDIYPEYKCVRIHEFNELAYFFAMYLESQNVAVQVEGAMWQEFFIGEKCLVPDYECMNIYAEGIWEKKYNWNEDFLRSVSVEFECIDKIYEENIRRGNINDVAYNSTEFFRYLKDKEVVLLGKGKEEQAAYDLILGEGVDIYGFVGDNGKKERQLLGKRIMSKLDVINECHNPVFINCTCKNSAWGFGEVDKFDYEGYKRNKNYFLLNDYVDIHVGNLHHVLRGKNAILVGNLNLCRNVERTLKEIEECNIIYWDILNEYSEENQFTQKNGENDVYFLIEPVYMCYNRECRNQIAEKRRLYLQKLKAKNVTNIMEYFSDREVFISIQNKDVEKYTLPCFTPGKILLNISGHMCGNGFFKSILDGHPNILMIDDDAMQRNLFFICMQLAEEKAENIKDAFWKIYSTIQYKGQIAQKKEIFNEKLEELLTYKSTYTSQELFVIFHIAYAKMWGRKISDIHNMVIYYEDREEASHDMRLQYEEWLCDKKVKGFSINITRNAYTRMGSFFNYLERCQEFTFFCMVSVWKYMTFEGEVQKLHNYWKRLVVKFETLKTAPKETLICICKELGIEWDNCLLETTCGGGRNKTAVYQSGNDIITGFDLKPVYNLYEQYFSDFDRLRINMIFSRAQSRFGYPYVSCQAFSGRQLQEMILKKFRFENRWSCEEETGREAVQCRKIFVNKARTYLRKVHMEEIMCKNEGDSLQNDIKIP